MIVVSFVDETHVAITNRIAVIVDVTIFRAGAGAPYSYSVRLHPVKGGQGGYRWRRRQQHP